MSLQKLLPSKNSDNTFQQVRVSDFQQRFQKLLTRHIWKVMKLFRRSHGATSMITIQICVRVRSKDKFSRWYHFLYLVRNRPGWFIDRQKWWKSELKPCEKQAWSYKFSALFVKTHSNFAIQQFVRVISATPTISSIISYSILIYVLIWGINIFEFEWWFSLFK